MRRRYGFTLNNPTESETTHLQSLVRSSVDRNTFHVRYLVFQTELSSTGTLHYQGYVELTKKIRRHRLGLQVFGSNRYHFELCNGSQESNIHYCKKPILGCQCEHCTALTGLRVAGYPMGEAGEPASTRPDKLKNVVQDLQSGKNIDDIQQCYPQQWLRHKEKIINNYLELLGGRTEPPSIEIYYGPTKSGKSFTARQCDSYYSAPWPTGGRWWWPDYKGEETLILDEFRHQVKFDVLLSLLDQYEYHAEYKGGNMQLASTTTKIIFTTNIDPKEWYPNVQDKSMLARRINDWGSVFDFQGGNTEPPYPAPLRRHYDLVFNAPTPPATFVTPPNQNVTYGGQNVNTNYGY